MQFNKDIPSSKRRELEDMLIERQEIDESIERLEKSLQKMHYISL